ncbi:MAG: phosphatidylserine decarboxylase, partial [Pseudomonadota bacterium]
RGLNAADLPKADAVCIAGDSRPSQPRYAMRVRTDENDEVVLVLRGAMISTRFVSLVRSGGRIGQGQRCGLLRFGGLVEVYVPVVSRVKVAAGATVRAGSDIIASLVHKAGAGSAEPKEVLESL